MQRIFAFRLLKGDIDSPALLAAVNFVGPSRIVSTIFYFCPERTRTFYGQSNPLHCMCRELNVVSGLFDFNISTSVFKDRLRPHFRYGSL